VDIEVSPAESAGSQRQATEPDGRLAYRRRLLGIGLGSVAAALVPAVVERAGASAPPRTDGTTDNSGSTTTAAPAATTTTAPPKRPTSEDLPLLNFLQGAELAANQLYKQALATDLDDTQRTVLSVIGQSHLAYGQALSGLLGREADNTADQALLTAQSSAFGGPTAAMLQAAGKLESTLVATHTKVIGTLVGTDAATLLASIVTIEARNGVVLADLRGATDLAELLVDDEADALTPAGS
jgi:hypothetical protein